jgi:hypothetical protein
MRFRRPQKSGKMPRMNTLMRGILLSGLVVFVGACGVGKPDAYKRDRTLYAYSSAIRWGDFETAQTFIEPDKRDKLRPSSIDQQRYAQVQVVGYDVRGLDQPTEDEIHQTVEIRLVNRHTQVERSVLDRQEWHWDAEEKRWWLTTGLPKFDPGR